MSRNNQRSGMRYTDYTSTKQQEILSLVESLFDITPSTNLNPIASKLCLEYTENEQDFKNTWQICLPQLSAHSGMFATVAALVNSRNPDACATIIHVAHSQLQAALDASSFTKVKIICRFFAELLNVGVIRAAEFVSLLDTLIAVLHETPAKRERGDQYAYIT